MLSPALTRLANGSPAWPLAAPSQVKAPTPRPPTTRTVTASIPALGAMTIATEAARGGARGAQRPPPASGSNLVGRDKTKHYGHYQEGHAEIGASSDTVRPEPGQHVPMLSEPGMAPPAGLAIRPKMSAVAASATAHAATLGRISLAASPAGPLSRRVRAGGSGGQGTSRYLRRVSRPAARCQARAWRPAGRWTAAPSPAR